MCLFQKKHFQIFGKVTHWVPAIKNWVPTIKSWKEVPLDVLSASPRGGAAAPPAPPTRGQGPRTPRALRARETSWLDS